jgi:hypothetical protein
VPLDRLVDYLVEAMVAQSDDEEREADSTQASDRTIH